MEMTERLMTVADYIRHLEQFPRDWRVVVSTQAGGGISVEHREINGEPVIAVFGANGGRFGENPLTEDEYKKESKAFLIELSNPGRKYTTVHGDCRMYSPQLGSQASCYGRHYDKRIIERMVRERLIPESYLTGYLPKKPEPLERTSASEKHGAGT